MGFIARGEISLSSVNDAYSVSLTPSSVVICADFDGTNPRLEEAKTVLTMRKGARLVYFEVTGVRMSEGASLAAMPLSDAYYRELEISLASISSDSETGFVELDVKAADNSQYSATARFTYSVTRDATMLDWIQDWEGSKTKIGDSYIMTPKLFVGKREDVAVESEGEYQWNESRLTGVYIGPDLLNDRRTNSVGLYGYQRGQQIFCLNGDGGMIGNWKFNDNGIYNGSIPTLTGFAPANTITISPQGIRGSAWYFNKDGSGAAAGGNINWTAGGDLNVKGNLTIQGLAYDPATTFDPTMGGFLYLHPDITSWDGNLPALPDGKVVHIHIFYPFASRVGFSFSIQPVDSTVLLRKINLPYNLVRHEIPCGSLVQLIGVGARINGGPGSGNVNTTWHIVAPEETQDE